MNSRMIIGITLLGAGAYLGWRYIQSTKKPNVLSMLKKPPTLGPAPANANAVRQQLLASGILRSTPAPAPLQLPASAPLAPGLTQQAFSMVPGAT